MQCCSEPITQLLTPHAFAFVKCGRSSAKKRLGFDLPVSSLCMPLCLPSVKSARMSFAGLPMNKSDKRYLCVLLAHSDDQATDALCVDQTMLNYSYAGGWSSLQYLDEVFKSVKHLDLHTYTCNIVGLASLRMPS